MQYYPYFLLATKPGVELEVEAYIRRRYEGKIAESTIVEKESLDLKNHVTGLKQTFLKVAFNTVSELMDVRRDLLPIVRRNRSKAQSAQAYEAMDEDGGDTANARALQDCLDDLTDMREYVMLLKQR